MNKKDFKTRFIVITGGVCSSIGKGVLISSIGVLLKNSGYSVSVLKWDPYLNVDPGTMSPLEHGEVFVTADGAETDLDLGHYERLIGIPMTRDCSVSAGQIFDEILKKERLGAYLGKTIQFIPHVADACKKKLLDFAQKTKSDFILLEIGGTVGDMEGEIFLEAIRQLTMELGKDRIILGHLSLVPTLPWTNEVKTKPTQHSVIALKKCGLTPDFLCIRSERSLKKKDIEKLSLMCGVPLTHIFEIPTFNPVYELFPELHRQGIVKTVEHLFGLPNRETNLDKWNNLIATIKKLKKTITIGLVAKYIHAADPYMSVVSALIAAGYASNVKTVIINIDAEKLERNDQKTLELLSQVDGILVPGGFDKRGTEGKILAISYAREYGIPYLGLCFGLQLMLIEFARNVLAWKDANSTELDPLTKHPIISLLNEQQGIVTKGATMRLGSQQIDLILGTRAQKLYNAHHVQERHRHRYEFNNKYRTLFEEKGIVFSGIYSEKNLVEIAELPSHPFMMGVQFHPEFTSTPLHSHPLFDGFIQATIKSSLKS